MAPNYQGKGYVFEAAYAVLEQTFRVGKHSKIYGVALKENLPSLAIIKKLGMTPEPTDSLYGNVDNLETYALEKFIQTVQEGLPTLGCFGSNWFSWLRRLFLV
ncbi:GNAT family N-acetyltransferase [Vibrio qinghaiensis]|uniref:GNAT family N-acetyltransferase n=1 Tax=Vibrio qinghaiensis TaxID=2025808 RepID=UPI002570CAE2|nr:GNAT family N-acetyltransferase [Vibrio ordalii]